MYFEKGPCFKRKTCGLGLGQLPGSESQEAFLLSFLRFYAIWHADSETIPEREHVHSVIILSICTCGIKTRERPGNETPDWPWPSGVWHQLILQSLSACLHLDNDHLETFSLAPPTDLQTHTSGSFIFSNHSFLVSPPPIVVNSECNTGPHHGGEITLTITHGAI